MDATQLLAEEVRKAVEGSGVPRKVIIKRLGCNPGTLSRYISGKIRISPEDAAVLADVTRYEGGLRLLDLADEAHEEMKRRKKGVRVDRSELERLQAAAAELEQLKRERDARRKVF